ncbi:MAG: hypothetical protein ACYDDA_01795 [Acidiferrobacteraceae bacterium]
MTVSGIKYGELRMTSEEHRQWVRTRKLEQQRQWRATNRRIDYSPTKEAAEIIDRETFPNAGGDYSSVISRIVTEWASGILPVPKKRATKLSG